MAALGIPAEKIRVHHTGVDLDRFAPSDRIAAKATYGVTGPLIVSLGALIPLALALVVAAETPNPKPLSILIIAIATVGVFALVVSTRYAVTVTALGLYLCLLDGPVKLGHPGQFSSALRDVLILAVVLGMLMRLAVRKERVTLPPLAGWVLGFVAIVLAEGLNPNTGGILKSLGGYRQELEWVPFFFFGYALIRDKLRFRQLFLVLGVIALANGVVGTVQSRLSPGRLAAWGPGYKALVAGNAGTLRTYVSEGVERPRPMALGSDSGFGGAVGAIALPGLLALLASGRLRRRWPVVLCCLGALLGIATAASRTSVLTATVALLSFALLSAWSGLRLTRPLASVAFVVALAIGVGSVLVAVEGAGVLGRLKGLTSPQHTYESGGVGKEQVLAQIPFTVEHAPFGVGLGTGGTVGGFGGNQHVRIEGERVKAGSAYNIVTKELGLPGLLLWVGFSLTVIVLAMTGLRGTEDVELRGYFAALTAGYIGVTAAGLSSATLATTEGAFIWFASGVVAYWFGSRGALALMARSRLARA
jgi:hypothetical protein